MNIETKATHAAMGDAIAGATAGQRQTANFSGNKDKLLADLKLVVADADKLVRDAAGSSVEQLSAAMARVETTVGETRAKLGRATSAVGNKARQASDATCTYVKQNPWRSAGIVAAAGLLAGMLLRRSKAPAAPE